MRHACECKLRLVLVKGDRWLELIVRRKGSVAVRKSLELSAGPYAVALGSDLRQSSITDHIFMFLTWKECVCCGK